MKKEKQMKSKLVLSIVMMGVLLTAGACSAVNANESPDQASIEVTIEELMDQNHIEKHVEIAVGSTLKVTLGSNPTTGFNWTEQAQIGDPNILQQTVHEYTAPDTDVPGAAGKEEWTFEALETGETTVSMEYSRPWEGGEKGEWTFDLTVTVK